MRVRIHRGSREIGGNCVEIEAQGKRLVIDLGRPLSAQPDEHVPLPAIAGLAGGDPSLLGLVISHPHLDHYGLANQVSPKVPIFIGEAANRILREAAFFSRASFAIPAAGFLVHRKAFQLGPFRVTPYLNDHSAFDAYSLLVEADGKRLFYSGDIRASGRKAKLFRQLLADPPVGIDVLLMEGTHVRAAEAPVRAGGTESDVESACLQTMRETDGLVLAYYSAQNIDRLVTLYRAAVRAGRELVVDLYTVAIAVATGSKGVPQPGHDKLRVFLPHNQRLQVLRGKAFARTSAVKACRIYWDEIAARTGRLVMTMRGTTERELVKANVLGGANAIWSLWDGYLSVRSGQGSVEFCRRHGIPLLVHHASGHAGVTDLQRLVAAIDPRRVVPIHSEAAGRFADLFPRVVCHDDGELWEA
jgi:ribonuclease J